MEIGATNGAAYSPPIVRSESAGNAARPAGGIPFSQLMTQFLSEADSQQHAVSQGVEQLATGEPTNIHDLAIDVAKADVAFRMVMEVRDQLIGAYQEIMRMQV